MLTNAAEGDRCNVKADGTYARTTATDAFVNAGTAASPIIVRGYSSTITDGYQGRNGNGAGDLVTTNFPSITYTSGQLYSTNSYIRYECLNISNTGASIAVRMRLQAMYGCRVAATNAGGTGLLIETTGGCILNSDIYQTGTGSTTGVNLGGRSTRLAGCRVKATNGTAVFAYQETVIYGVQIFDSVTGISASGGGYHFVAATTIRNCTDAYLAANSVAAGIPAVIDCHITDCGQAFDSLYVGTGNLAMMAVFTRTRDNTSADAGFPDWPLLQSVTTDTGGPETDYADYASNDLRLINGAPGADAGVFANDIGAVNEIETAGGSTVLIVVED